ncbi:hypothetical protein V500_09012 [Pseudogymnoascus sp. VKM F-4518 (FW-2643)]|nr:hypothetical protein V500_09012 [Pseudogymnoascus sp. VKM F-4518 (FW-2643)]
MRASILFVASVLPVLSLANDSDEAMNFLDSVNICATSIVQIEAAKNSCGLDIACLCRDDDFIATIMAGTTCTPTQLVEFGQLVAKECSSHGVTVDIPNGDAGNSDSGDSDSGNSGSGNSGSGDSNADKSDTGNTDDKVKNAQDKPNWAGRATMVNLGVMLGVAGMAGLVGVLERKSNRKSNQWNEECVLGITAHSICNGTQNRGEQCTSAHCSHDKTRSTLAVSSKTTERESVKTNGKQQDSKNRTREMAAIPAFPGAAKATTAKMTTPVMNPIRTKRGLTNLSMPLPTNRPIAKYP